MAEGNPSVILFSLNWLAISIQKLHVYHYSRSL